MIRRMILLTCAVVALAGTCFAGEKAGKMSISPFVGGYSYDGDEHLQTRPVYGLRLGYDLTDSWGVEGVFDYVAGETTGSSRVPRHMDMNAYSYRLDVLYNVMPRRTLVPYLAVGGGGRTIEYQDDREDTSATLNYGAGIKYFLAEDVALRGDVRHVLVFQNDDHSLNNLEYTLGMTFAFGGARAATRPAAEAAPVQEQMARPAPTPPPAREQAPTAPAPVPAPVPVPEPTPEKMKYCVSLKTEFDIDRADIRPEYRDEVARVGDFMKKYPSTTAVIEGHADEVGTEEYNMQLSQRRAESVVRYLVENFGIDASRLSAKGYGKTRPIADNSTEEGRQKNRRIDAIIDCTMEIKELAQPPERLCVTMKVQFDSGKADIKPEYGDEIAKVGEYMKKYPTTTAVIEGHTDNVGSPEENMRLSQERADNVMNYLVKNFGIEAHRITAKGYGDTRRIAYNDTPEGRQMNRRINAVIDCVVKK